MDGTQRKRPTTRIYAKCIHGQQGEAMRRIWEAIRALKLGRVFGTGTCRSRGQPDIREEALHHVCTDEGPPAAGVVDAGLEPAWAEPTVLQGVAVPTFAVPSTCAFAVSRSFLFNVYSGSIPDLQEGQRWAHSGAEAGSLLSHALRGAPVSHLDGCSIDPPGEQTEGGE